MKTLDRYLVREMLGPFMVGVVGFILVLAVDLLFTMADLIINKGFRCGRCSSSCFTSCPRSSC